MVKYKCIECGKTKEFEDVGKAVCCGKHMKKIDDKICIQPAHAEHARPMDSEEPCDDGRAGK